MRLSVRLAFVFGIGALVAVTTVAAAAWVLARGEVTGTTDDQLRLRVDRLEAVLSVDFERPATVPPPTEEFSAAFESDGEGAVAVGVDGAVLLGDAELATAVASLTDAEPGEIATLEHDGRRLRAIVVPVAELPEIGRDVAFLVFYTDITAQSEALGRLGLRLVVLAVVAIIALGGAGWFIGRRLARPIDRLAVAAGELARLEDLPARIEVSRDDEVGRLADSFNRMLSALEVGREQQQRLVADASHELRTPLASLRMRVEFLHENEQLDVDVGRTMLHAAVADLEQLSSLVNELVDLAADVRSEAEEAVATPLAPILEQVAERTSASSRRRIEVEADDSTAVVRPGMIRRAVQNLVDNALKYGGADDPVTIRLRSCSIEVCDRGPGIAEDDLPHVFDRFYRSPQARSRPGHGIGLAIVKQVADAHGGRVWAGAAPGGGARVGFSVWR